MKKLKILLADDHAIVRMGLKALIDEFDDCEVVGQAKNGPLAVSETVRLRPDVVVMDMIMPLKDGAEATAEIKKALPGTRVLILTTYSSSDALDRAFGSGADGAVFKSDANNELMSAIRHVAAGDRYVSPAIRRLFESDPPVEPLTERQREILLSMARGLTDRDIAKQFGIRLYSAKEHVKTVLRKLGAANRAEAVAIALRKQLVQP